MKGILHSHKWIDSRSFLPLGLGIATLIVSLAKFTNVEQKPTSVIIGTGIALALFSPYFVLRRYAPRHAVVHLGIGTLQFLTGLAVSIGMANIGEPGWVLLTVAGMARVSSIKLIFSLGSSSQHNNSYLQEDKRVWHSSIEASAY